MYCICLCVRVRSELDHPHILRLVGISTAPGALALLTEWAEHGDLFHLLR